MKILNRVKKSVHKLVEKRAGIHVYRPVMNAQKWADWAAQIGMPNPKSADDLAVSIFKATGNVAVIAEQNNHVIRSTSCVFAEVGTKGLAVLWYDYGYYDRHWTLRELAGSEICGCTGRAMLVLSDDVGDFELTDEMLATAPASIVLDGEKTAPLGEDEIQIQKSFRAKEVLQPTEAQKAKAAAQLLVTYEEAEPNPFDQAILYDISKGHQVLKSEVESASAEIAEILGVEGVQTDVEADVDEPKAPPAPEVVAKKSARDLTKPKLKSDNERRIIYGWASVSQAEGEVVKDYAGDEITEDALHDLCHLIVKGQNQGAFEHDPDSVGDSHIVEAFVFDKPMQDALGIDLGRTGVLIGMHIPGDEDWAEANDGDWEFSINATAVIEAPAEQKEAA